MKNISILVDDPNSWFIPYANELKTKLEVLGNNVMFVHRCADLPCGDICFFLSCTKIVRKEYLARHTNNIVIHASDLPKGKGFTPLKWQILEGANDIVLTLFEAVEAVDSGDYYFKEAIHFMGHELLQEMYNIMGPKICNMAVQFVVNYENMKRIPQEGAETTYRRRNSADDEIDVNASIAEQFNHIRIADNDRYPLWFSFRKHKYIMKIYPAD